MTTTITGYEAGDAATLHLHVVPDGGVPVDGTTTATLVLTDPDGAPVVLADPAPVGGDRSRWAVTVTGLRAGTYVGRWVVTGTGEGRQPVELAVAPAGDAPYVGRTYATTGQFAEHLGAAPPAGAHRLLVRASERVDLLLRTAVYAVDGPDDLPTDPVVAAALAEATCAQAAWMAATGDDDGSGVALRWSDVKIGTVQLSGAAGGGGGDLDGADPRFAPGAVRALRAAGLYGAPPWVLR